MNTILIGKNQKKIRIDQFIKNKIHHISRNQIQKYIKMGYILVNKRIINNNYIIQPYDHIKIDIPLKTPIKKLNFISEKIDINIIHEDDDILIINKPSGMVVHPGYGNESGTLINGIKYYLNSKCSNLYRCGLVHRLDKDTSGILVVAKNNKSQKNLIKQFFYRKIHREYIALVWGKIPKKCGIINGFIKRNPKDRKKMINSNFDNYGKYSITYYNVIERFNKYLTYVSCKLGTGRTHQIRVHFKYIGHPIFNDSVYNKRKFFFKKMSKKYKIFFKKCFKILSKQALHAVSISLIHPNNGKKCYFYCPIPNDLKKVLKFCRDFFHYNNIPCNIK
ncbi:RluA family pseudouridine synthase [Blattabacterium cuenoti]|uniref:RluA family pseudouridine synthase n=1 Tax=Blattabacterium cuenoti TaxID=1653831 RepID=UPI00163C7979|nr:RluA family pseudouridine synthase [Blattabacterium cuenoti]